MTWGEFVIAGLGIFAISLLLIGLGLFVGDELVDGDDPEWEDQ